MNNEVINLRIKDNTFTCNTSHFIQHPNVLANIPEAIEKIVHELESEKNGSFIKKTVDLGKVIGKREAIELNGDEKIFYAQRIGRKTLTKFVSGVKAEDCSSITFIVSKVADNKFRLITAYVGYSAEKEPLDPSIKTEEEFNRAKKYWDNTAMIDGMQVIFPNTITTKCPWDTFENRFTVQLNDKNTVQEKIKEMRQQQNTHSSGHKLAA